MINELLKKENAAREAAIINALSLGATAEKIGPPLGMTSRACTDYVADLRRRHKARNNAHLVSIVFRKNIIQ